MRGAAPLRARRRSRWPAVDTRSARSALSLGGSAPCASIASRSSRRWRSRVAATRPPSPSPPSRGNSPRAYRCRRRAGSRRASCRPTARRGATRSPPNASDSRHSVWIASFCGWWRFSAIFSGSTCTSQNSTIAPIGTTQDEPRDTHRRLVHHLGRQERCARGRRKGEAGHGERPCQAPGWAPRQATGTRNSTHTQYEAHYRFPCRTITRSVQHRERTAAVNHCKGRSQRPLPA